MEPPADKTQLREKARRYLGTVLDSLRSAGKQITVQTICDELRKIPFPFVGTMLANAIQEKYGTGDGGDKVTQVLDELQKMQASDREFEQYFKETFDKSWSQLAEGLTASIDQRLTQLSVPNLKVSKPEVNLNYPFGKNTLDFSLSNVRGGSIMVEEIYVDVVRWVPNVHVDYSVPAAPKYIRRLKVRLSNQETEYPLLKLNGQEGGMTFGPNDEGAEYVMIEFSSAQNANFDIRLRINYFNPATDEEGVLYYPSLSETPVTVPFFLAPGWNNYIKPESVLERGRVIDGMVSKFQEVLSIFEEMSPSLQSLLLADARSKAFLDLETRLRKAGMGHPLVGGGSTVGMFIPTIVDLALLEKRQDVLEVVLRVTSCLHEWQQYQFSHESLSKLLLLINNPSSEKALNEFVAEEDFSRRKELISQILASVRLW